MNESRICVLSGRYPMSGFSSIYNHRAYCNQHGYTYINCSWPTGERNPYLNKIAFIREYFDLFDHIFWIDDDAFFMNLEKPLTEFLAADNQFLSICASPTFKGLKTFFSSGQFDLRCSELGRGFLQAVMTIEDETVKNWWRDDYGFYTGGDQDRMVYLCNTEARFKDAFALRDYKQFNSRVANLFGEDPHEIFILHFTGSKRKKRTDYARVQKFLGRGPSLLKAEHLESLKLQAPFLRRAFRFLLSKGGIGV